MGQQSCKNMCPRGLEQQLLRESGSVMRTRFCVWTVIISYRADTEDGIGNGCTGWSTVNEVEFVVNRIVCFSKPFFIGMTVLVQNIIQITDFVRIYLKVQICFSRQYSTLFETEKKNYTSRVEIASPLLQNNPDLANCKKNYNIVNAYGNWKNQYCTTSKQETI